MTHPHNYQESSSHIHEVSILNRNLGLGQFAIGTALLIYDVEGASSIMYAAAVHNFSDYYSFREKGDAEALTTNNPEESERLRKRGLNIMLGSAATLLGYEALTHLSEESVERSPSNIALIAQYVAAGAEAFVASKSLKKLFKQRESSRTSRESWQHVLIGDTSAAAITIAGIPLVTRYWDGWDTVGLALHSAVIAYLGYEGYKKGHHH